MSPLTTLCIIKTICTDTGYSVQTLADEYGLEENEIMEHIRRAKIYGAELFFTRRADGGIGLYFCNNTAQIAKRLDEWHTFEVYAMNESIRQAGLGLLA